MKTTLAHLKRLIGNPNVVAYQKDDGTWRPKEQPFTDELLEQHLKGWVTLGTYLVKPPDQARTLVFDIDQPAPTDIRQAETLQKCLRNLGVPDRSIGVEFSGRKGYHVWVPIWDYVPAASLRHLGRIALLQADVDCEVFPKQDAVTEGGLGNLVKLPGGVHRVSGRPNDYISRVPQPMSVAVLDRILKKLPPLPEVRSKGERPVALECMANIQAGVKEGGRNHALFQFVAHARRASIDEGLIRELAHAVNQRFEPPLGDDEVNQVLDSSLDKGPICRQLPAEIRCSDCPILREKGLYEKPSQVREGAEGELVVVRIGKKNRGYVELVHPDVSSAKAALK